METLIKCWKLKNTWIWLQIWHAYIHCFGNMIIVYCFAGKRSRPRSFTWQYFCVCACMCFCVSNLFTLIHTDWCSILFSSHRGLTSSCRSWRSQDWYQYERICISVWKILEGFGLYEEFIYFPHFHETFPKTSLLRLSHLQFWLWSPGGIFLYFLQVVFSQLKNHAL